MLLRIPGVLTPEQVAQFRARMATANWADGGLASQWRRSRKLRASPGANDHRRRAGSSDMSRELGRRRAGERPEAQGPPRGERQNVRPSRKGFAVIGMTGCARRHRPRDRRAPAHRTQRARAIRRARVSPSA